MTRPNNLMLLDHIIPAHAPWSGVIKKGQYFRIIDTEGQQAVDTLFYNEHRTDERYSPQDTLLAQNMAYVSTGTAIMSNEGNVMLTVTDDTSGLHDTSVGCCSREANVVRFGEHTRYEHACRENFLLELARYGLNKRDLAPNLNFFMCVPVQPDGTIAVVDGVSKPGNHIEMRAEMDVLCVISNCPQINNPCNGFDPTPVRVQIWAAA
ncbi:MAG: DUF1989 domain-containing protein [Beijerinckiaceae bacterium]|nr:DUF1989 domain-containing protein [Beijerinckiaceae bacterium]